MEGAIKGANLGYPYSLEIFPMNNGEPFGAEPFVGFIGDVPMKTYSLDIPLPISSTKWGSWVPKTRAFCRANLLYKIQIQVSQKCQK